MKEELHKYYTPNSFIKKEVRYNFILGFILGAGSMGIIIVLIALFFFIS